MNWAIMRSVVAVCSGGVLFQIAAELGVKNLAKFEACTEFRATAVVLTNVLSTILQALERTPDTGKTDDARATLQTTAVLLLGWYTHYRGVRLGRWDLQVGPAPQGSPRGARYTALTGAL